MISGNEDANSGMYCVKMALPEGMGWMKHATLQPAKYLKALIDPRFASLALSSSPVPKSLLSPSPLSKPYLPLSLSKSPTVIMKFTIAVVATFFAAVTSAQDPSELPECALPCFIDNVDVTDCTGVEDYACLCAYVLPIPSPLVLGPRGLPAYMTLYRSEEYDAAVTQCVLGACSLQDA
jgi:hypothetical protein